MHLTAPLFLIFALIAMLYLLIRWHLDDDHIDTRYGSFHDSPRPRDHTLGQFREFEQDLDEDDGQ